MSHLLPGTGELRPGVAGQHGDDDHLSPLLHVHQQVTQLSVVLVDQVNAIRAHFLESHHHAAGHQLQMITTNREKPAREGGADVVFFILSSPVLTVELVEVVKT